MNHSAKKQQPVALVLSGGGALGAAHIGFSRELLRNRLVSFFAGTSAGAIVSAALACGMSPDEISNHVRRRSLLTLAWDVSLRRSGLIRGEKILAMLRKVYDDRDFSDLPDGVSLRVCATDFVTGELVVLQSGSIAEAVRASIALPGLIAPFELSGRILVDGGLVANLPLGPVLKEYDGSTILAVDVCSCLPSDDAEEDYKARRNRISFRGSIERSLRIMFRNQNSQLLEDSRVVLARPNLCGFTAMDITKLRRIEEIGAEAYRRLDILR